MILVGVEFCELERPVSHASLYDLVGNLSLCDVGLGSDSRVILSSYRQCALTCQAVRFGARKYRVGFESLL